ncbi:hypothetical protein [Neobacillus sp. D3-1R]|uniref:hypothetical protein n=1 Tax=Neobacillus sp. D3-1R TaxID=3445778 RepID=UPI003FA0DA9B
MKNLIKNTIILFILGVTLVFFVEKWIQAPRTEESITFFPLDATSPFKTVNTNLSLIEKDSLKQYSIQWRTISNLSKETYLRQDIGLLFRNGRLVGKMGEWKQNINQLVQESKIKSKESQYLDAVSYHYAEIHYPNEHIMSSQDMSKDELYIVDSPYSPLRTFRIPSTKEEDNWKRVLDQTTAQTLTNSWKKSINHYHIDSSKYKQIPLTQLAKYLHEPFPGFSQLKTNELIGKLWEGLYKNYFLGIKKENGTSIDPINSTVPLILLSNDKTHIFVLIETSEGEPTLLRQQINY